MKKVSLLLCLSLISLFNISKANASACSNEEIVKLKKQAAAIKATFEEKEEKFEEGSFGTGENASIPATYLYFVVSFSGMSENYYIEYSNDYDNKNNTISYNNLNDGVYSFEWNNLDRISKITYIVYTSSKTSCPGEKVLTGTLVLPKYNNISSTEMCKRAKDLDECQKYVTKEYKSTEQFQSIEKYLDSQNEKGTEKKWYQKLGDFVKNHIIIVSISGVIIVGGVATFVIIKKRKGSDEI